MNYEDDVSLGDILRAALEKRDAPKWIVNDLGELGVMVNGRAYFLYKGESLEYNGFHDDGSRMFYRSVQKREFGETCLPPDYADEIRRIRRDDVQRFTVGEGWHFLPERKE